MTHSLIVASMVPLNQFVVAAAVAFFGISAIAHPGADLVAFKEEPQYTRPLSIGLIKHLAKASHIHLPLIPKIVPFYDAPSFSRPFEKSKVSLAVTRSSHSHIRLIYS